MALSHSPNEGGTRAAHTVTHVFTISHPHKPDHMVKGGKTYPVPCRQGTHGRPDHHCEDCRSDLGGRDIPLDPSHGCHLELYAPGQIRCCCHHTITVSGGPDRPEGERALCSEISRLLEAHRSGSSKGGASAAEESVTQEEAVPDAEGSLLLWQIESLDWHTDPGCIQDVTGAAQDVMSPNCKEPNIPLSSNGCRWFDQPGSGAGPDENWGCEHLGITFRGETTAAEKALLKTITALLKRHLETGDVAEGG